MAEEMLLAEVVSASHEVAATSSRTRKVAVLAACLTLAHARGADVAVVASWLAGSPRQRRTGVGWRSVTDVATPAESPTLGVAQVESTLQALSLLAGPGSNLARAETLTALFSATTAAEQQWLAALLTGQVRQGALDALVLEAVAKATEVPLAVVRRASMLAGSTADIAPLAFDGGREALEQVGLEVLRPVQPMLASSAPDVEAALAKLSSLPVTADAKLDGIRLQVHKHGDEVVLATRSLDIITDRLPEVVDIVRALPAETAVLDGEAMWLADDGRPRPFQETASRTALTSSARGDERASGTVTPYFFDLLHLDGRDLLDTPGTERWAALEALVPEQYRVARLTTNDPEAVSTFAREVLAAGHEGVVLKSPSAPYQAGRRGAAWVKVKPVHTLDLVVLGVEWGSGRRRGWLSNIHLGARDPSGAISATGFVMVGKTFKGMTDAMLAWQTERFTELATTPVDPAHWVVEVRPEQVVEIAIDGVQRSTRYPGGAALRFARVVRYRDDKSAAEADTIDTVRSYLG